MFQRCPSCKTHLTFINIETIPLKGGIGTIDAKGVAYVCPIGSCRAILGVGVDPFALKTDTINGVIKVLRSPPA